MSETPAARTNPATNAGGGTHQETATVDTLTSNLNPGGVAATPNTRQGTAADGNEK